MHGGFFDLEGKRNRVIELDALMQEPDFWNDQERARTMSQEREELQKDIAQWERLSSQAKELHDVVLLAEKEHDHAMLQEATKHLHELQEEFSHVEFLLLFAGKYDSRNAIVTLHAGSGGTDAQDWAEMLERMYLRFFDAQGWHYTILEEMRGKEAGIKRAMIHVTGRYVYGMMKTEAGVHRLVRISPFDAEKMRHTSFALVEVTPEFDEIDDVKVDDKDIKVETSTASGHGGQSVNTTYSAIRLVHIPTGITVSCQNERSQKQNKEMAMKILKSKLFAKALEDLQKEKKELRGEYKSAEWGNQIRSYVLHPYTLVKDHRNKFESQNVQAVLDGGILPFIEHYLRNPQ